MDYQVIAKAEMPKDHYFEVGKWQRLFGELPSNQAVRFDFESMGDAQKRRNCLRGCFRGRTFHTRIIRTDNNGRCELYAWLDKKS